MGDDAGPDDRVPAAMLSAAIGGAVMHPLVADLDDDTLRSQLLHLARRFLDLPDCSLIGQRRSGGCPRRARLGPMAQTLRPIRRVERAWWAYFRSACLRLSCPVLRTRVARSGRVAGEIAGQATTRLTALRL